MQPIRVDSVKQLLVNASRQLRAHGWALIATGLEGWPYHYTVGLQARGGHPELEAIGLDDARATHYLGALVARIAAGERLRNGDFFSDLARGYDLFLVRNPAAPHGPPLTGGRLRLVWPDARHRYPWHADCAADCAAQRLMAPTGGLDLPALKLLLSHSGASGRGKRRDPLIDTNG